MREAFEENFIHHNEIGASVCIYVHGRMVVDLWAGYSDIARKTYWQPDQLVNAFSVGKGVTSLLAAQCVADGLFSYETRMTEIWPEFGGHGKDQLTVRDVLGHKTGLPAIRHRLAPRQMFNWMAMCDSLASEKPWWQLDGSHGYHVNTFGYLIGEIIRRCSGKSVGQLIAEKIAGPLDVDIYLGVPLQLHARCAEFEWPGTPPPEEEPPGLTDDQLLQFNSYYNPSGFSGAGVINTADWRNAEIPSTNMHVSARGVAKMYSCLVHNNNSHHPLVPDDVLNIATSEVSVGDDIVLQRKSRFAHGFQIGLAERSFGPNLDAFGHFGAGGSMAFADPVAGVGLGYVMNQMGPRWQNPRNQGLNNALYSCL